MDIALRKSGRAFQSIDEVSRVLHGVYDFCFCFACSKGSSCALLAAARSDAKRSSRLSLDVLTLAIHGYEC